jgi:hypothetical protein
MNRQRFSAKILLSFLLLAFLILPGCNQIKDSYDDLRGKKEEPAKFTVSGTVSGDVKEGVTITLSSATSETTTTDQDGNYSFEVGSGNYTITPSLKGYTFSPAFLDIVVTKPNGFRYADFKATAVQNEVTGDTTGLWDISTWGNAKWAP